MMISTLRFGDLEIPGDRIITMAKPVLGFEQLKKYCIIEREDCQPFLWFQSVDNPSVAFLMVNPLFFFEDYRIEVNPKEIEELRVDDVHTVETYGIVTIPPADPANMSINLQGPILINTRTRLAKQLVLVNSSYSIKHYLMKDLEAVIATGQSIETMEPAVPV
nr:flagellar assembly protein FliW [candidate division Zixibacteria bacterium]